MYTKTVDRSFEMMYHRFRKGKGVFEKQFSKALFLYIHIDQRQGRLSCIVKIPLPFKF